MSEICIREGGSVIVAVRNSQWKVLCSHGWENLLSAGNEVIHSDDFRDSNTDEALVYNECGIDNLKTENGKHVIIYFSLRLSRKKIVKVNLHCSTNFKEFMGKYPQSIISSESNDKEL